MKKITIRRRYDIGTCCGDERQIWVTEEVTPQELRRLINRCEKIRVIKILIKNNVMITEDYVSFEVASLLKEKGFDEPCRAYWDDQPKLDVHTLFFSVEPIKNSERVGNDISCPTPQMVMEWLREVHNLHIAIERGPQGYHIFIETLPWGTVIYITREIIGTTYINPFKEAVECAIKFCLEKLI